jgi:hypothetical protein
MSEPDARAKREAEPSECLVSAVITAHEPRTGRGEDA